ncbi:MAG: hypothetical protein FJY82_05495 [Candidatus Aminicenantes bacterium]|nr:hypothetical protein [Candidatus Aminicenantes bacterium]
MIQKKVRRAAAVAAAFAVAAGPLLAAVGCELNDPDRDVRRLFPGSTGFKTIFVSIARQGGEPLLRKIEDRLGDKFQGLYETADVPYTMYQVFKGNELIGYIHGVNQKGRYGGIQVFLALDLEGTIRTFYYQKLTNREAKLLRDPSFGRQFVGLRLSDFDAYDPVSGAARPGSKVAGIKNPAAGAEDDFKATLRAVKKNLILCQVFLLNNKWGRVPNSPECGTCPSLFGS